MVQEVLKDLAVDLATKVLLVLKVPMELVVPKEAQAQPAHVVSEELEEKMDEMEEEDLVDSAAILVQEGLPDLKVILALLVPEEEKETQEEEETEAQLDPVDLQVSKETMVEEDSEDPKDLKDQTDLVVSRALLDQKELEVLKVQEDLLDLVVTKEPKVRMDLVV